MINKQSIEPRTPKGMRDFLPADKRVRDSVLKKMTEVFESYGFEPLDTPAVELKEILLGKIGSEEKLIYDVTYKGDKKLALRYDQTVPLARVVSQYSDLPKPFKRYQIGNVYRADNPQKGRFREFLQVDIDTVGSSSSVSDGEIIECAIKTYQKLGFKNFEMLINSRPLLFSTIQSVGIPKSKVKTVTATLDKKKKIGYDGMTKELEDKGISTDQIYKLYDALRALKPDQTVNSILEYLRKVGVPDQYVEFDPYLSRGLDYYTGAIFECEALGYSGGSIGGGGRYDGLIGVFSNEKTPAVGFSFGFEPIIDALKDRGILNPVDPAVKVLVIALGDEQVEEAVSLVKNLRKEEVPTEFYPDPNSTFEKQVSYATRKRIPYVAVFGPKEKSLGKVLIRDVLNFMEKPAEYFEPDAAVTRIKDLIGQTGTKLLN